MSTTITNPPSDQPSTPQSTSPSDGRPVHRRRRAVVSVVVAAALGFGAGAAVVGLTSSSDAAARPAHAAPAVTPNVDVEALWKEISTLPERDEANVVAALTPNARGRLEAVAAEYAAVAEH